MADYTLYEIKVFMFIADEAGNVLFMKNDHPESIIYGYVNPPAGHLEPGETITEAVKREIREEVGLSNVSDVKIQGLVNVEGFKERPVFMVVVSGKVPEVKPTLTAKDEGTSVWLSNSELPEQKMLEDVQKLIETMKQTPKGTVFQVKTRFENRKLVQFIVV